MKKPKSSRAILIKNQKILLIYRKKMNRIYYVLPGGKTRSNESQQETLIRTVKEEINIDVISFKKFTEIEDDRRFAYYYFVNTYGGSIDLGDEIKQKKTLLNQYKIEWIDIKKIKKINLVPVQIKQKLIEYLI